MILLPKFLRHLWTMMLIMFISVFITSCGGCSSKETVNGSNTNDTVFHFIHNPANAVYHWKTVYNPNMYEVEFLKKHEVKRIYIKFFDVGTDNLYDGKGEQPVPIATTVFKDSLKTLSIEGTEIEIVPVVFITVEALRLGKPLSERIVKRIDDMCRANHINYREIQLDCDWTRETKVLFYSLCQETKQLLHKRQKGLSSTIRLHQLKDTLPDIDYGVLMLYNTESLQNPSVKNSILSSKTVKEYMRHARSDKHLDFAYPTYEWTLWFKEGKYMGILSTGDTAAIKGDLRHERSDFKEIMNVKNIIKPELMDITYPSSVIIYHLDSANLSRYSDNEINKIYSR